MVQLPMDAIEIKIWWLHSTQFNMTEILASSIRLEWKTTEDDT